MFCPECGRRVPDNARFCTSCGCSLHGAAEVEGTQEQSGKEHETREPETSEQVAAKAPDLNENTKEAARYFKGYAEGALKRARMKPEAMKPLLLNNAIYLGLVFVSAIILFALLTILMSTALSGAVEGMLPASFKGLTGFANIIDPRLVLALVSLGFGGSLGASMNVDLGPSVPVVGALAQVAGSAECAVPLLLAGVVASAISVIYAVKLNRNTALYGREITIGNAVVVGLAGSLVYMLVELVVPYSISASGTMGLSISGLSLRTFISMWLWIGFSVFVAETLRQGRLRYGSVKNCVRHMIDTHPVVRDLWHMSASLLGLAVASAVVVLLLFLIASLTKGLPPAELARDIVTLAIVIIATPLALMTATFLIGAPASIGFEASQNAAMQAASQVGHSASPASVSSVQDVSFLTLFPLIGVAALLFILVYLVLVLMVGLVRRRAIERSQLVAKETVHFAIVAAVVLALVCWFTGAYATANGGISLFGGSGSVSFSLSWMSIVSGAVFAVLVELAAVYVIPRVPFLARIEQSAFVGVLAGMFGRKESSQLTGAKVGGGMLSRMSAEVPETLVQDGAEAPSDVPMADVSETQEPIQEPIQEPMYSPCAIETKKKTPNKKLRRRIVIAGGCALVVVVGAVVAFNVLSATIFSPRNLVEQYYNALADGNIAAASELCDPNIDAKSRVLLVEGTLDNPQNRIQDVQVGDFASGAIPVTYRLDGVEQHVQVPMQEDGTSFLIFKKYKMASPALMTVPFGSSARSDELLVNGVEVNTTDDGSSAPGVALPVYPGIYAISQSPNDYMTSNDMRFVVSDKVQSETKATDGVYDFTFKFTPKLNDTVTNLVKRHLEAGMATGQPDPPGAPFGVIVMSDQFAGWAGINKMPTITPGSGSTSTSTSAYEKRRHVLKDGAVYYGSVHGGSMAYRYRLFSNRVSDGTTQINQFDVYVKVSNDQVTLEDSSGEVLSGLDDVSTVQKEDDSVPSDGSSDQPKSDLTDYSWEDLSHIAKEIEQSPTQAEAIGIAKKYRLVEDSGAATGAVKSIELVDGSTLDVELIGVSQDAKTDSGKAGLTFIVKDCYGRHPMNATPTNKGGWRDSDMRKWLNSSVLNMFPDEVKQSIVPVDKLSNNVGPAHDPSSVSTTSDKLWLLSWREMFGDISWNKGVDTSYIDQILNAEGTQYQYFQMMGLADAQASDTSGVLVKHLEQGGGGPVESWWTRSSTPNRDDGFGDVNNGGIDNGGTADVSQGVVFGFCL